MLRVLVWLMIVILMVLAVGYYDKNPQLRYNHLSDHFLHPLDTRVRYRIGSIDARFGVSEAQVRALALEAAQIWTKGTGKEWFVYDEKARLAINLVYDERQATSTLQQKTKASIEQKIANQDKNKAALESEKMALQNEWQAVEHEIALFNKKVELAKLNQDWTALSALDNQRQSLQARLDAYKAQEYRYNEKINQFNSAWQDINAHIAKAQQHFPSREFHKGVFDGRKIDVYEFKSPEDLRLTIAHELGHALDIDHHGDPKGLMYTHAGAQDLNNFTLQPADITLLKQKHDF